MADSYAQFLNTHIDLAPVGAAQADDSVTYFCTPQGASIIGWAGVDGIHFCFLRGFGEMVFAVSPMNPAPDFVHPLAETFTDFLRLLLACGDTAALEQAWMWDNSQFEAFLKKNPATAEQRKTLDEIAETMHLTAMERPWEYIHALQSSFDYSKIEYTEDYYDMDMNPAAEPAPPEWKVYFEGSFWGHQGTEHAGEEIPIGAQFEWAGYHWLIPAVYACSRGLVVDFCMRVEAGEIRAFMEKWNLTAENDSCENDTREQQMELELDNPLCLPFNPQLELNGKKLRTSHGCSVTYNPCLPDGMGMELKAKWAAEQYGLDTSCGWVISRSAFPWNTRRRPDIKTLALTMEQQSFSIPGPHFEANAPGEVFHFVHPVSRTAYTLTVQELKPQTLPSDSFGSNRWRYPTHYLAMRYTLSPETSEQITVSACDDGDRPIEREAAEPPFAPAVQADACVGVIGSADEPTVFLLGGRARDTCSTACSALHFEPVPHDIAWRLTFYEKKFDDVTVTLK